jgi:2-isopropylmalate synthase
LPIHPRHPYVGDLVFTAFSGSHQDAIKKGMAAQREGAAWAVPYLPIDPADLGRTYDSLIRVNSQSGKGGIAYLLERDHHVLMPRRMQIEFSAVVQAVTDSSESEMTSAQLWALFQATYLDPAGPAQTPHLRYVRHQLRAMADAHADAPCQCIDLEFTVQGQLHTRQGHGNGPLDAAVDALGGGLRIVSYEERALGGGADAQALAIVEVTRPESPGSYFGAGQGGDIVGACLQALLHAAQRAGGLIDPADA